MLLAITHTRALIGIQAPAVTVEVHISQGLPGFTLVGLAETSVKEARDRVRSAIINSGFTFPAKRITVNLAPADLSKEGGRFDLPIALGILAASQQLPVEKLQLHEFIGELSLSGTLSAVTGAIPALLATCAANRTLILPENNGAEAALVKSATHYIAPDLLAVCAYLHGQTALASAEPLKPSDCSTRLNLQDVIGQQHAKRALEIAASGAHHTLFLGPPGTGKTMLASRLNSLLPPLTEQEALESAAIASLVCNYHSTAHHWQQRPFRSPHHSASIAALVGGGTLPTPGEISLAHNGVLFLDELPEFERRSLDALRQPLESGEITVARANRKICFPARFQLIAAMNPSPSGYYTALHPHGGLPQGRHHRSDPQQILRYLNRLSGPLLDRFDLSIEVPSLPRGTLSQGGERGEDSASIKTRVVAARALQYTRRGKLNAVLDSREVEQDCRLTLTDAQFLENALLKLGLSIRAWHKILKVTRTIADLEQAAEINRTHLAEALSYRAMDRLLQQLLVG